MKNKKLFILGALVGVFALQTFAIPKDWVWTTWYLMDYPKDLNNFHPLMHPEALRELFVIRQKLNKNNLADTNTEDLKFTCVPKPYKARSADGSCNDEQAPAMGAAGMRLGRNFNLEYLKVPNESEIMSPNPRDISIDLLTRDQFKPVPFLNLLAASWIQFMVHDWVSHGENPVDNPMVLPLKDGDPLKNIEGGMIVYRSNRDQKTAKDTNVPQAYRNEVTSWWDGSQIYGSNRQTQDRLRSHKDGKMLVDSNGHLPIDPIDGVELTGFKRNWWTGLDMLHQLFVLEHNSIAETIKKNHPEMGDEELFDRARLVNVAVMAKIHTVEWTPGILPNPILDFAMNANWYGVNSNRGEWVDVFKFIHDPELNGIVGGRRDTHGVPYSITEEFTSVYRLHSLLPEAMEIRSSDNGALIRTVPLPDTRDEKSHLITDDIKTKDILYSMGVQHPGMLELNNFPKFMQELQIKVPLLGTIETIDLATIDLIRDRERGVPRYNEFRTRINLKPISSFEQLTDDKALVQKLKTAYGNDVNKLDLLIGCLAEGHRPSFFGFGETQFQIFVLMASRRLQSDPFFTTYYNDETYTKEGIKWVKDSSFKSVILRHFPELSSHLDGVTNAFNPWH